MVQVQFLAPELPHAVGCGQKKKKRKEKERKEKQEMYPKSQKAVMGRGSTKNYVSFLFQILWFIIGNSEIFIKKCAVFKVEYFLI